LGDKRFVMLGQGRVEFESSELVESDRIADELVLHLPSHSPATRRRVSTRSIGRSGCRNGHGHGHDIGVRLGGCVNHSSESSARLVDFFVS
jgi:hypothetical protein